MSHRPCLRYPSDLSDAQWSRLQAVLPAARSVGRHRSVEPRDIANAINYRWETGCVWRMMPHDFPPWGTVYAYFRLWQRAGVIRHLREILLEPRSKAQPPRVSPTPNTTPSWPSTDSPRVRNASNRNVGDPRQKEFAGEGFSPPLDEADHPLPTGSLSQNLLD